MLKNGMPKIKKVLLCLLVAVSASFLATSAMAQGTQRSMNDDLMYRISFGRVDDVKALLEKGAETNIYGGMGDTPLVLAIARNPGDADDIIKALLAKGADPNFPDKNGNYPLEIAIKHDRASLVSVLIEGGADIHMKSQTGLTMIDTAMQMGKPEVSAIINDKLQKEVEHEAKMREPTRLLTLIHEFSSNVCEMTYWNNYLMSEQNPKDNASTRDKIDKSKNLGEKVGREIATYFPKVQLTAYIKYATDSTNNIFKALPTLKVREEYGIGTDKDVHTRCTPIADGARASIAKVMDDQRKAAEKAAHQAELMR